MHRTATLIVLPILGLIALLCPRLDAQTVDWSKVPPATLPAPRQKTVYQGDELKDLMKRVMSYQVKAYGDKPSINWQAAPFWTGVMAAYKSTGDEAFYAEAKKWGQGTQFKISNRFFHADDTAVGQAYEEMYLHEKDP